MAHFAELKIKEDPTGFTTDEHQVVQMHKTEFLVLVVQVLLLQEFLAHLL